MHLLAAQPGSISDGSAALDLGQLPGDIVFLSSADTELACLAAAQDRLGPDAPSLRLVNLLRLGHNLSIDLYLDKVVSRARLVILRLLGGAGYWSYGVEQLASLCRERGIAFRGLAGRRPAGCRTDGALDGVRRDDEPPLALLHRGRDRECDPSSALCRDADRTRGSLARAGALAARRPLLAGPRAAGL